MGDRVRVGVGATGWKGVRVGWMNEGKMRATWVESSGEHPVASSKTSSREARRQKWRFVRRVGEWGVLVDIAALWFIPLTERKDRL